jgi:GntR family transcriptional repressor for pyruvate dehydrogenase complex
MDTRGASPASRLDRRFDSVSSQTLSRQISRRLLLSILRGDVEEGAALPSEDELAGQFDVSRPVIREAVRELAVLGLIQSRQGRATRVTPRSSWNHFAPELLAAREELGAVDDILLELLELRRLIEIEAAALAATRATDEDVAAMATSLEQMDNLLSDTDAFTEADIEFHQAMLGATRNHLLTHLIDLIGPLLRFGRKVSVERRPRGTAESQAGHREILAAVRARDADAARDAMRGHLSWTANLDISERERLLAENRDRPG